MKRFLMIMMGCCFIFLASTIQAQVKVGPVAGLNLSTMTFKSTDSEDHYDPQMLTGFHVGVMAEFSVSESFVIQPALLFSGKGSSYEIDYGEGVYELKIAPGFIATEMVKSMKPEALEKMSQMIPLGRLGEPEEIGHTALYILENDYFTGRIIEMDGGIRI